MNRTDRAHWAVLRVAGLLLATTACVDNVSRAGEGTEGEAVEEGSTTETERKSRRDPPPAAAENRAERESMVRRQISHPADGREPVRSEAVLDALRVVPRHVFMPEEQRRWAYADRPLSIGHGQTISQPYIVAMMTELLELTPDSRVLEVGTGSGYQAAVLAHLTPHVYTVEIVEPLARAARKALSEQGYDEIECRYGDGYQGWLEKAPFDAIIVTCAPEKLPPPLWEQLKPGGRIVIPVGGETEIQRLVVVSKTEDGKRRSRTVTFVRFVPLTRNPKIEGKTLEPPPQPEKPQPEKPQPGKPQPGKP